MVHHRQSQGRCLVTGSAGFVGSHLAERLLGLGFHVIGVDNFFSGHRKNMASFLGHPKFAFFERSITERGLLGDLKERYPDLSCCFHLAAIVSVPYSMEHSEETMDVNYRATVDLLEQSNRLGLDAFVFAGSAAEYGDEQRLPLREEYATEETRRLSPYGEAKFLASRAVGNGGNGTALRFFNIYGPRQDPSSPYSGVISQFISRALRGQSLSIYGDGRQTRDFVYVSDVVEAYLAAAGLRRFPPADAPRGLTAPPGGRIFNVGTGSATSILDLAHTLNDLSGNREPVLFQRERPGDIRHSLASVDAFRNATGWKPEVSLQEGLRSILEWYSNSMEVA